jgi:hypothetical protein
MTVMQGVEIWTEGKTDWQILKKAQKKLGIDLNIEYHDSSEDMGNQELLRHCKTFVKKSNSVPMLFMFDRDNDAILCEIEDSAIGFKNWGNNVYSFAIPS